ncbi:MAG: divergent polysaccharide deacetylase family protein [Rhodospirillaceae bacterium]|nr:divergent polysaccharide deacetylase family protein [Rhodospirillaceae bacterium]
MRIPGPPRTSFALFGGPVVILVLLAAFGIGAAALYLAASGRLPSSGASLSLPGNLGDSGLRPAESGAAGTPSALKPLEPMAAEISPSPPPPAPPERPMITEDLSPIDLLVRYTPDPHLALTDHGLAAGDARRFRRPSAAPADTPHLALVVTGLGLDRALTAEAILALPPDVTLSFAAGSADLEGWIAAARAYGHEALIDLELGAADDLAADAAESGDDRLLAELGPQENLRRLDALLARAPEAAGVAVAIADSFLADAAALTPILERLQAGGFIVVGLPVTAPLTVAPDRVLDQALGADRLAEEAVSLKALARRRGNALVLSTAGNAAALADNLARPSGGAEIALVPASALVEN